jgi:hypothetical protein
MGMQRELTTASIRVQGDSLSMQVICRQQPLMRIRGTDETPTLIRGEDWRLSAHSAENPPVIGKA